MKQDKGNAKKGAKKGTKAQAQTKNSQKGKSNKNNRQIPSLASNVLVH